IRARSRWRWNVTWLFRRVACGARIEPGMGSQSVHTIPSASDQPVRHFKWLRRGCGLAVLLVLGLLALRFVAAWKVTRDLGLLEQRVRSAGGVWTVAELNRREVIPDQENAAFYYLQAAALYEK